MDDLGKDAELLEERSLSRELLALDEAEAELEARERAELLEQIKRERPRSAAEKLAERD